MGRVSPNNGLNTAPLGLVTQRLRGKQRGKQFVVIFVGRFRVGNVDRFRFGALCGENMFAHNGAVLMVGAITGVALQIDEIGFLGVGLRWNDKRASNGVLHMHRRGNLFGAERASFCE